MTKRYAEVIGDPIAHSKSPAIHNFWLDKLGIDAEYRSFAVKEDELAQYFSERCEDPDWVGCNVTSPHKRSIEQYLDRVTPTAMSIGAINTVLKMPNPDGKGSILVGENTDARGFAEPFREKFMDRGDVLLIGAGGAARAIYVALKSLEFGRIHIANRSAANAKRLLKEMQQKQMLVQSLDDPVPDVRLVVNTTSLGMDGQPPLDLDVSRLHPATIIYDIVYAPLQTKLMKKADDRNLRTIDGLTMLIGQADAAFFHFFGKSAPRQHDEDLRALLTA